MPAQERCCRGSDPDRERKAKPPGYATKKKRDRASAEISQTHVVGAENTSYALASRNALRMPTRRPPEEEKKRRVVITGRGVVTPFGDLQQSVGAVRERRSAIGAVRAFDASSFGETRGGECHAFDARAAFRAPKALKLTDQRTRLAVGAACAAVADAGIDDGLAAASGVIIGTSGHDMQTSDVGRALGSLSDGDVNDIDHFATRLLRKLPPLWLLVNLPNMASAHVAIQLGAHGPNSTVTTDWICGLQAIGEAARWIGDSDVDVVIAGGADSGILPMLYATLDREGSFGGERPFVPGEGAALFVLEELEHARARGARILGEVTGYASSAGDGALERTMTSAQRQSGSESIDLLCDAALFAAPHADAEERAIAAVFVESPPRFECHSLTGFPMGAAAPIALALAPSVVFDDARAARRSLLVNSLGSMRQAASLAVTIGDPS